jgi:hypothetical protein
VKIEISIKHSPKTITRYLAAAKANCSLGWIDQCKKNDIIDYTEDGRNVLIVVNAKFKRFLNKK